MIRDRRRVRVHPDPAQGVRVDHVGARPTGRRPGRQRHRRAHQERDQPRHRGPAGQLDTGRRGRREAVADQSLPGRTGRRGHIVVRMDPAALRVTVADGVRLHVRHWPGEPDRTPFLLVHGLSSNARLWDGVATRLAAAGYPAYAVDLRSHGESERPPDGYDTATAAADVAAVADTLDLPP